ncbi:MAG: type 1 glutamine amidotransferase [Actinomycetota bacterium]|nr:type 1 glutamine amidotransferase [Actinomycetota bacterium]
MRVLAVIHQDDAGLGVFGEALPDGASLEVWRPAEELGPRLVEVDPNAVIILGGAMNAHEEDGHPWLRPEKRWIAGLLSRGVPVLGVCLGAQLLAEAAGGSVRRVAQPEIGWHEVRLEPEAREDPVLGGLPERFSSFQWHSYEAVPPRDAAVLARSGQSLQAYRLGSSAWGIQFHAEVNARTLESWIGSYRTDPDAVAMELDPNRMRAESAPALEDWNELGRGLARRFLEVAERQ